jgi:hypothetical protein
MNSSSNVVQDTVKRREKLSMTPSSKSSDDYYMFETLFLDKEKDWEALRLIKLEFLKLTVGDKEILGDLK